MGDASDPPEKCAGGTSGADHAADNALSGSFGSQPRLKHDNDGRSLREREEDKSDDTRDGRVDAASAYRLAAEVNLGFEVGAGVGVGHSLFEGDRAGLVERKQCIVIVLHAFLTINRVVVGQLSPKQVTYSSLLIIHRNNDLAAVTSGDIG